MSAIEAEVSSLSVSLAGETSQLLLIFAMHFSMLFWLELQGTLRLVTVCLICARKRSRISAIIYIENQESKKAAARAIYNASPETKRAAYHASYRADPEEKRVASRVAPCASCLPPRVPLFKAYLCSCCMLWSARISRFMTETDSTLFTTRSNKTTAAHTMIKLPPKKWQKQVT